MWQNIRANPRKFWQMYQGPAAAPSHGIELDLLQHFWEDLYGGQGRGALMEAASSVADLVESLQQVAQGSLGYLHAAGLNDPLTEEEIVTGLKKLHMGRAPGPDGMRSEFLKQAYVVEEELAGPEEGAPVKQTKQNVLAPVLHALFNALFTQCQYAQDWSAATLSAVFKKGDAGALDNYRAIAVGAVLGKLYAVILETRLTVCAEKHGWRARGQAGFRPDKSTVDQVFILRHMIEAVQQAKGRGTPKQLFCCFVDFRKAYDLVPRDLLLRRLAELGIHGPMLSAIAHMYWSVPLIPKHGFARGTPIDSTCGVKQGDPLSPLLFGLFIDELEQWLKDHAGMGAGARLGAIMVHLLLYADDLALLSHTKEGLQRQLDALSSFCGAKRMAVNLTKTEIVVFRPQGTPMQPDWQWTYQGSPVQISAEFKYLGIIFHETKGVRVAVETLTAAARRAMWAMLGKLRVARITDISMKLRLFKALVSPILEYCSAVWAPDLLRECPQVQRVYANDMQQVQNTFLRQLGRLRPTVPVAVLHRELCSEPLASAWMRSFLQFWYRAFKATYRPTGDMPLVGRAAIESMKLASTLGARQKTWGTNVMAMIRGLREAAGMPTGASLQSFLDAGGWRGPTCERLHFLQEPIVTQCWQLVLQHPGRICHPTLGRLTLEQ